VRIWTAHEKPNAPTVLLHEGFSPGALIFGPIWLAVHRAWVPASVALVLTVAIPLLTQPPASVVLLLGLAFILGFLGHDLVRWSLARRGYLESNLIIGRTEDEALRGLLEARPDLVRRSMVAETAP